MPKNMGCERNGVTSANSGRVVRLGSSKVNLRAERAKPKGWCDEWVGY
jgi:hypothetical protein